MHREKRRVAAAGCTIYNSFAGAALAERHAFAERWKVLRDGPTDIEPIEPPLNLGRRYAELSDKRVSDK